MKMSVKQYAAIRKITRKSVTSAITNNYHMPAVISAKKFAGVYVLNVNHLELREYMKKVEETKLAKKSVTP